VLKKKHQRDDIPRALQPVRLSVGVGEGTVGRDRLGFPLGPDEGCPGWPTTLSVFCPHGRRQLGLLFWEKWEGATGIAPSALGKSVDNLGNVLEQECQSTNVPPRQ
jgi:hypothetical protein